MILQKGKLLVIPGKGKDIVTALLGLTYNWKINETSYGHPLGSDRNKDIISYREKPAVDFFPWLKIHLFILLSSFSHQMCTHHKRDKVASLTLLRGYCHLWPSFSGCISTQPSPRTRVLRHSTGIQRYSTSPVHHSHDPSLWGNHSGAWAKVCFPTVITSLNEASSTHTFILSQLLQ